MANVTDRLFRVELVGQDHLHFLCSTSSLQGAEVYPGANSIAVFIGSIPMGRAIPGLHFLINEGRNFAPGDIINGQDCPTSIGNTVFDFGPGSEGVGMVLSKR